MCLSKKSLIILNVIINFLILSKVYAQVLLSPTGVDHQYQIDDRREESFLAKSKNTKPLTTSSVPAVLLLKCKNYNYPFNIDRIQIEQEDSDDKICRFSVNSFQTAWDHVLRSCPYINEAKRRNLDCISYFKKQKRNILNKSNNYIASKQNKNPAKRPLASVSDTTVCYNATIISNGNKAWNDRNENFVGEANYRGLDCGVKTAISSKPQNTKPLTTSYDANENPNSHIKKTHNLSTI